jgi:GTPase SAR1 family protein
MSTQNNNIKIPAIIPNIKTFSTLAPITAPINKMKITVPLIPNIKVLLMGIPGSGKTMTVKKVILNIIVTKYIPTIGGVLYTYKNEKNNNIDIWDIGGKDPYPGITDGYCKNVNYCIIFSNLNNQSYINLIKQYSPNVTIINFTNEVNFKTFLDNL